MNQKRGSVKLAARQKAREARTTAVAERIAREKKIDTVLARFFEADMNAETVIEAAQQRADQILTAAKRQADSHREATHEAIRELAALGETRAEIMNLTGLAVHEVRHALVDGPPPKPHRLNTPHCP